MSYPANVVPLTLLVMTCNEAANIGACLDSVPFAQEKVVIDSGSDDNTAAIAAAHGAHVVSQSWLGYGQQRNFANALARHEWILFLDADERLSEELATEIVARMPEFARNPSAVGLLPAVDAFHGRPDALVSPHAARVQGTAIPCRSRAVVGAAGA